MKSLRRDQSVYFAKLSDLDDTTFMAESERTKEPLDESERGE